MTTQNLDDPGRELASDWLDNGPATKGKKPTMRMCLATREAMPISRMIRFVRDPDDIVVPDLTAKLPGRGVWVRADKDALASLCGPKGGFSRGFKAQAKTPDDLVEQVENALVERCQATLGLAKRSGAIILGFDQVRSELQKRRPGWLIEASNGAEDGRRRLIGLGIALYERVRVATALSGEELGMAFGRDHVVHGLLRTGRFTDVWTHDYRRLYEFRQMADDVWVSGTVGK